MKAPGRTQIWIEPHDKFVGGMVPSWLGNVLPSVLCIQVLERTEFLSPRPDKA
jgi:hypothetical protein